ncbi:hypothetical protein TspCOW1_00810 [Thiohalobacter sp. COW1]|uniref:TrbI F-type domain-containing protein n=1 Tax=Thiohalobacter sp. COW1 TaxID=2795687 RepID=UPI001915B336|nr:TrbI F-type domain-containing protein [Thiohalobacter sp. COW1]BCO29978.1 hypothetical protein TspCOW1_00810 [Thiohalobacter sp. COW1]
MIRQALFAMAFGALGAIALQGVIWLTVPQPPRFAQVDLVAIMETEIAGMARQKIGGSEVDPQARAARIQSAVAAVAAESGRTILARQALIAGPMDEVPDLTDEVRRQLR